MKRPLVVMSVIITAIVFIYLIFSYDNLLYEPSEDLDGSSLECVGVVSKKELKIIYSGDAVNVLYLIPDKKDGSRTKYIECYLNSSETQIPCIGEKILVKGIARSFKEKRNPGEFDSRLYYSTLKISYRLNEAVIVARNKKSDVLREYLYKAKCYFEGILDDDLNSDDSAIMKAVLLGDRAFMDDEIKELYKNSGIVHILAVSGLHISLMGMGLYKLIKKLNLHPVFCTVIPLIFMYLYGEMCGISTSSFRAICMFVLRLLAPLVGRTYDLLSSLALSEILLILDQPLYLYNSGFLFSFGAVIGIAVIKPGIEDAFFAGHKKLIHDNYLLNALLSGISILFVTLPVYLQFYYTYPIYSLITNIIVIPLMGLLLAAGGMCIIAGAVTDCLNLPGCLIHFILLFYRKVCGFQNNIPGNMLYFGHKQTYRVVIYALLMITWFFMRKKKKSFILIPIAITILTISIPHGLKITAIDVGQGDGIVITTGCSNVLIDGGSSSKSKVGKYSIIPYLSYEGIGSLDAVIVSHEDEDHISGIMEILTGMEKGGIKVKQLILPDVDASSRGDNYHKLEDMAKELNIPINYISKGESFEIKTRELFKIYPLEFTCLNPTAKMQTEGANAYSTVLHMRYGSFTALFTGDVEKEGEEQLKETIRANMDKYGEITLLKVAHHGSSYTTDEEILTMIKPKAALISCGVNNRYGHPHKEVLDRLKEAGTQIYRTDKSGAVSVRVSAKGRVEITGMLQ